MSTSFASEYDSLQEILEKIKPCFESIDSATTTLFGVSSADEIIQIDIDTSQPIVNAQLLIIDYRAVIASLQASITEMEETDKVNEEQVHYDSKMSTTDGKTSLPLNSVSLSSLMSQKESRYNLAITRAVSRANTLSNLDPSRVVQPVTSTNQSAIAQFSDSSPAHEDSISTLSSNLSQLVSHVVQSNQAHFQLESFDGSDITRWRAYKFQLDQLVLNKPNLSNAEKAFQVRNSLKGVAYSLIASLPVNGDDFLDKMMTRLTKKYDDHALTQAKLLQSLHSIRPKSRQTNDQLIAVRSLINIAHTIDEKCGINSLDTQQQVAARVDLRFVDLIWDKQPQSLLAALELIEDDLEREIRRATLREAYSSRLEPPSSPHDRSSRNALSSTVPSGNAPAHAPSGSSHASEHSPTGNSLPSSSKPSKPPMCVFCDSHPYSYDCPKVTSITGKKTILNKKSLCYVCFSSDHSSSDCHKSCPVCHGKHHKSLCGNPPSPVPHSTVNKVTINQ